MAKAKWLITNGDVGTEGNAIMYYSRHPIGQRHLRYWVKQMANRTGKPTWAEPWPTGYNFRDTQPRLHEQQPD
jgi:hypothetical protein